jgi:hypothetical protein
MLHRYQPSRTFMNFVEIQSIFSRLRMKTVVCFLLIFSTVSSRSDVSFIASALIESASKIFIEQSESFDLIIYGKRTQKLRDIANEVTKITKIDLMVIEVRKAENLMNVNRSAILLFETKPYYLYFHYRVTIDCPNPKNLNFLVFIENSRDQPTPMPLSQHELLKQWRFFRYEFFLYFDFDDSLRLITFTTFQQPSCREWNIVELNRFTRGKLANERRFIYKNSIEKFQTFNGCRMRIKMPVPQVKVLDYDYTSNSYHGYGLVFNEVISKSLNYTYDFIHFSQFINKTDDFTENFMIQTDSMQRIKARKSPLYTTHRFTTIDEIFLISRPHPYTQFEKVFMPFQKEVWWWLVATFSTAVLVICVVKLLPKRFGVFFFGNKMNTPILNLM